MTFAQPIAFFALLLLPLAVLATALRLRRARARVQRLAGSPRLRATLLPARSSARLWSRLVFRSLALVFLTFALARPQWGGEPVTRTAEGRDIVLAIDTSRSMLARDVPPDRLEFAKLSALDFVRSLPPGDRVAVIAFAGAAFTIAPLTDDRLAIEETIIALDTSIIPLGGTRIAAAIDNAIDEFNDDTGRRRALIVLSDGEDLEGDLVESARKLRNTRLNLLALGIGSERGELLPLPGGGFILDETGRPVLSKRDMNGLAELAREAGGAAHPFGPGQSLAAIAQETLEPLDRFLDLTETSTSGAADRYQWFLIPGVFFLLCAMWHRPRLRRPEKTSSPAPATAYAIRGTIAALALLPALTPPARASNTETPADPAAEIAAAEAAALAAEEFAAALAEDTALLLRPDRRGIATGAYNLGTRLYDHGREKLPPELSPEAPPEPELIRNVLTDWRDALGHLEHAVEQKPDFPEASRNADKVRAAIEELEKLLQQQEPEQEQEQDEQEQDQQQDQSEGEGEDESDPQQQQQEGEDSEDGQPQDQPGDGSEEGEPQEGDGSEQGEPQNNEGGEQGEPQDQQSGEGSEPQDDPSDTQPQSPGDDVSTGDFQPQTAQGISGVELQRDENGNWILPEDPRDRAEVLEAIRRTLEQRANEDKDVRLIPEIDRRLRPRRDW